MDSAARPMIRPADEPEPEPVPAPGTAETSADRALTWLSPSSRIALAERIERAGAQLVAESPAAARPEAPLASP